MTIYTGFSHKKMVIFHSYVSLPAGTHCTHDVDPVLKIQVLEVSLNGKTSKQHRQKHLRDALSNSKQKRQETACAF